jgi:leucyl-tRNA synthetase
MKKVVKKNKIERYFPEKIERKWQLKWQSDRIYEAKILKQVQDDNGVKTQETYYNLVELPYPSGDLHLGHWFAFVPPDAHARYMRMKGRNVLFPNGFDAFGLPAENAAIKHGIHPKDWTLRNIQTMKKQFATMGTMIDWTHSAITCEPDYYHWNQWIFLKMYEKGLAYRGKTLSNWCPKDQTVLANEHIEDGKCWRCATEVEQKEVEQWFLKITDFADELLWENTDEKVSNGVEWPKSVREAQNNWIGRSEGLLIRFKIKDYGLQNKVENASAEAGQKSTISDQQSFIEVFTTRPDTTDGATFLVVAPEHEFVSELIDLRFKIQDSRLDEIREYVKTAKRKTELERKEEKVKTGVFTGISAINPVNGKEIPIWIADYVLAGYGTGAIMAVPYADERDKEFAQKFNLPIEETKFNAEPEGEKKVNYHLRDWSISRQRYWGTPIPIIYCHKCWEKSKIKNQKSKLEYGKDFVEIEGKKHLMVKVSEDELPVTLPYEVDFTPTGKPPLASAENWSKIKCPQCGGEAKRDAETLDTFFDSAWYYYRYVSPGYDKSPFDIDLVKKAMPIDVYFGGGEHTLGHTLYARFFTKFFKSLGLVDFSEFALKRIQHGVILGPDGNRMSKSRGNVVNPDDVVREFGADTVRLYLCFMMPYDATAPWNPGAISGVFRFLKRVWELQLKVKSSKLKEGNGNELSREDEYWLNKTVKKVGEDLEKMHFNTAVSALMEWINYLDKKLKIKSQISLIEYETFIKILAPFAPHMTEEIWQTLNPSATSLHLEVWPEFEKEKAVAQKITIAVQINGKLRGTVEIEAGEVGNQPQIEEKAKADLNISKHLKNQEIKKTIYIPGKILSFVI